MLTRTSEHTNKALICGNIMLLAIGLLLVEANSDKQARHSRLVVSQPVEMASASGKLVLASPPAATEIVAAKEGADLDLSCPIEVPSEDMIISWSCENEPANIRSSRVHVTESGKLRIRSAKVGDSCNYRCEAAEGFGTVSVIIKVLIVNPRQLDCLSSGTTAGSSGLARACQLQQQQQPEAAPSSVSSPGALARRQKLEPEQEDDSGGQKQRLDLDVQLEPAVVRADKGRTISLECRVMRPALAALAAPSSANSAQAQSQAQSQAQATSNAASYAHLPEPQIIWLKEFIGQSPSSLSEAHEQNLALIDGVYYHALNWPRSITYKRRASGLHSALLVRNANYLHSGKYICFAGYPPYTMGRNLSLDYSQQQQQQHRSQDLIATARPPSALRYRMAVSQIHVNDPEGLRRHRDMFSASNSCSLSNFSWPLVLLFIFLLNLYIILCAT